MAMNDKDFDQMRKDLDELKGQLKTLSDDGGDLLSSARNKLEAEASRLMDGLKSAGSSAAKQGEHLIHTTEDKIEDHPWGTVLVSMGVGLALGMLMRRR